MVELAIIGKILLNVFGFIISYESLQNAFVLGLLLGLLLMIISLIIPQKDNKCDGAPML